MADLNTLVIFAKAVEANSFSEAARRLKMPVSSVSRRIAEMERLLGVSLLERSTRGLRLTNIGASVLDYARRGAELSEAVDDIVSDQLSEVSGLLRLSAPPSISDTLLAPLVGAFQTAHPNVRVQIFVTDRFVDHIADGVDLVFRVGVLKDSSLVARTILNYREQLVASPAYLAAHKAPAHPRDLHNHRLLTFEHWRPEHRWNFVHVNGRDKKTLAFTPYLSMNDYAGLATAVLAGAGIGELPPVVQPELLRAGRLVEVMPKWRFRAFPLSLVHLSTRHVPRAVRAFTQLAANMSPKLFQPLPS
jgi:DNA-binding transcriptional LysR family regulator